MLYKIIPASPVASIIDAESPESAIVDFACVMDLDMNTYFKAVPSGEYTKGDDSKNIPMNDFLGELKTILASSIGSDYAYYLANKDGFAYDVKTDVEQTSAWNDEGFYTDDDIRLAIGRVLLDYLGVNYG